MILTTVGQVTRNRKGFLIAVHEGFKKHPLMTQDTHPARLAIKIDVDTDRGTRDGVLPLARLCQRLGVPATFLFSLGPDNTGKAITRVFRPGFFKKVTRTNVAGNYGLRTLLSGTILPAPDIGRRRADVMRAVRDMGFEVGIHCWDHFAWQDYLQKRPLAFAREQFQRAQDAFIRIFGEPAQTAGAPGWQANAYSLQVYDEHQLLYGSDTRGAGPFFPSVQGKVFRTLQIPTTLPTLDEWLGRAEYPEDRVVPCYLELLAQGGDHVHTIHAEMEGLRFATLFEDLLQRAKDSGIAFFNTAELAKSLLAQRNQLPVAEVVQGEIDGRSGTLALQKLNLQIF